MTAKLQAVVAVPDDKPQGRRDRTRAALIKAGEMLMSRQSFDAISIDEIVLAAGVAKGTFYNHFADKEELNNAVLETIRADQDKFIAAGNVGIDDPARRIARGACVTLRYNREHPQRALCLTRSSTWFKKIDAKMNQGVVRQVSLGIKAGRFPIATTESGVLLILGVTQATLIQMQGRSDPLSVVALAQQLGAMVLRGLGLPFAEAELIAAQEADTIIAGHDFVP